MADVLGPAYSGATYTYTRPAVTINGDLLTNTDPPDSFTVQVYLDGTPVGTPVAMQHDATTPGNWYGVITAPATTTRRLYELAARATKGSGVGEWVEQIDVRPYP